MQSEEIKEIVREIQRINKIIPWLIKRRDFEAIKYWEEIKRVDLETIEYLLSTKTN